MNSIMRRKPGTPPAGHETTIKAILLSVLGIFEVTFDILSLIAALLGGFTRDTSNTRNTSITAANVTTEEADQVAAPQVIALKETPDKRPIGVTLIAVFLGILGLLEVGFGGLALVTSLLGSFILPLRSAPTGGAIGVYYLLVGLVKLLFVWGLWQLHRWAFWTAVVIAALSLLSSGILAITQPSPTSWVLLADLLISTVILVYFVLDSHVRTAFHV